MKTLIYCTGYASSIHAWQQRYRRWLDGVKQLGIADQILIVDDGSPALPGWEDLLICSGDDPAASTVSGDPAVAVLHHHPRRLGRHDVFDCPGWYRSFGFGPAYALAHGFERVIHIESDCFVVSERLRAHMAAFTEGWTTFWSERYQFPELSLQIAAGRGLRDLHDFTRRSYDHLRGQLHETLFPFHHVERDFEGDRIGETKNLVPLNADFVCQVPVQREASYYWWLPEAQPYDVRAVERTLAGFDFSTTGNGQEVVREGWSGPEDEFRWMVDGRSALELPPLPGHGDVALRAYLRPFLHPVRAPCQRLWLLFNGVPVDAFELTGDMMVGTMLPAHLVNRSGSNRLDLIHPIAVAPAAVSPGSGDVRELSFAMSTLTLSPTSS